MIDRFRLAAADIFCRPAFYWVLAAIFVVQRAFFVIVAPRRFDAEGMWEGAHAYLTNPSHMYEPAAEYLARLHIIAPPGGLNAFVSPPPVAALVAPIALLPRDVGAQLWTAIDATAMLLALWLLFRVARTRDRVARAAFWLAAIYYPPLFADVSAGQRGGVLLVLAMASIWLERNHASLAGIAGGIAASIKYYPAAMIIGPRPAHRVRYTLILGAVALLVTALTFVPLGFGGAVFYYQHVLLPSLGSYNPDCAYDSVRTLFTRTIGGEPFAVPSGSGYQIVSSPLQFPALALFLSYVSAAAFAGGAAWAAWRSGWNPAYGMALGFALGALIPNEVWPYQWLPLLPITLLLLVRSVEERRWLTLALIGICLLGFLEQPCELFFPNIWTIAGIGLFVLAVWENRLFRTQGVGGRDGGQR